MFVSCVLCTVCLYMFLSGCSFNQISPCGTIKGLFYSMLFICVAPANLEQYMWKLLLLQWSMVRGWSPMLREANTGIPSLNEPISGCPTPGGHETKRQKNQLHVILFHCLFLLFWVLNWWNSSPCPIVSKGHQSREAITTVYYVMFSCRDSCWDCFRLMVYFDDIMNCWWWQ